MKGLTLAIIGVLIIVIVVGAFAAIYFTTYNNLVSLEGSADAQWANVQTQLV